MTYNSKMKLYGLHENRWQNFFKRDTSTIDRHVNKIYKDDELQKTSSERKLQKTQFSSPPAVLYNLDMIISVGYRVNSKRGIEFRKWATKVLNKYLIQGYAVNDKRLEQLGDVVNILIHQPREIS